jgi:GNAT superfamily N-acetyltransferase
MIPCTWTILGHERYELPAIVPGRLILSRGRAADYALLGRFHYRSTRPATWAGVWMIRHLDPPWPGAVVALAVLSWPTLACHARNRALGLGRLPSALRPGFINTHIRTISRIIVHPAYRSMGLAAALVRCLLHHSPTRYTEALAMTGQGHRVFERAGMTRFQPPRENAPAYYLAVPGGACCVPGHAQGVADRLATPAHPPARPRRIPHRHHG